MLAVAAYCLLLLFVSVKERRLSGWDVDIAHIAMGVAMAGMFITAWAFGPAWAWELTFFVLMIWFIARSIQSIQEFGIHLPHYAVHAADELRHAADVRLPRRHVGRRRHRPWGCRRPVGHGSTRGCPCSWRSPSSRRPSSPWPRTARVPPTTGRMYRNTPWWEPWTGMATAASEPVGPRGGRRSGRGHALAGGRQPRRDVYRHGAHAHPDDLAMGTDRCMRAGALTIGVPARRMLEV